MATWSVEPTWKKSVIERQYWTKDGNTFVYDTGWRWGVFHVYTDDDNPPDIEAGVNIYDCGYETELIETWDGCWDDFDWDECDDDVREWIENFLEEGNSVYDLEEHGWINNETEMIIDCDLQITRVNDDGTKGESVVTSEDAGQVDDSVNIEPGAKWPFPMPEESNDK